MSTSRDKENTPEKILADLQAKAIKAEQENAEAKRKVEALEQRKQEAKAPEVQEKSDTPVDLLSISKQIEELTKTLAFLNMDINNIKQSIEKTNASVAQNESSIGAVNAKLNGIIETAKVSDAKMSIMETAVSQASQSIATVNPQFVEMKALVQESNTRIEAVDGRLLGFQNSITRIDEIVKTLKPTEKTDDTQEDPLKTLEIEEPNVG